MESQGCARKPDFDAAKLSSMKETETGEKDMGKTDMEKTDTGKTNKGNINKGKGREGRGLQLVLGLALAVFIIALSATAGLNLRGIYSADIDRYGLTDISGLSKERLEENFRVLVDYNNIWGAKELDFPDFPMSEHGRIHFEEVKRIFCGLQLVGLISAVIIAAYVISVMAKKDKTGRTVQRAASDLRFLKYGAMMVIIIPAVLGGAIAINWDMAFVVFHKLLFRNDYWLFDLETDPVITVLPDQFFMHVALVMIGVALLSCAVCLVAYIRLRHDPSSLKLCRNE